ncbi:uncharacterized protein LOC122050886 [Zingiber officinale]|uniref:Uncharacterized protein n=1 Tax=Zingiber officinale TaxID=94328 RepID=A0A8J5LKD7_ZINOF|nr:uncharacterized protein LOC122050886 [Zingiber officinale]KAG6522991.1 hypothetical protein ZIOFF_020148 [Zingiber officinale]
MVAGFRRSISLSGLSPSASPSRCRRRDAHHTRSASFPCRSHPTLSLLQDEIRSLRASAEIGCSSSSAAATATSAFERIDRLLASLDNLIRLPQTQDSLRRRSAVTDRLLDAFLRLADAQGSYRSAAISLAQHAAEARAASRRRDPARLASTARSLRRTEKEIAGLAAAIKDLARCPQLPPGQWADAAEAEVVGILAEAAAAAMAAVFSRSSHAAAAAASSMVKEEPWRGIWGSRKKTEEGEEATVAMAVLEETLEGMEEGSGRLYRRLINIRVSLLNIVTPSL